MSGIEDIARFAGVPKESVQNVFEAVLQLAHKDEVVRITGFGTFNRRLYKGRTIASPKINGGEPTEYADSYALRFKQSTVAKQRLNRKEIGQPGAEKEPKSKPEEAKAKPPKEGKKPVEPKFKKPVEPKSKGKTGAVAAAE